MDLLRCGDTANAKSPPSDGTSPSVTTENHIPGAPTDHGVRYDGTSGWRIQSFSIALLHWAIILHSAGVEIGHISRSNRLLPSQRRMARLETDYAMTA